jgi:putative methionine-R-sulfoxide reductase with GAF domain
MKDENKTKDELISELVELRQRFADLAAKNERVVGSWRDLWASHEAIVEAFYGFIYICSRKYEVEFMNKRFISHIGRYPLGQKCYEALYNLADVCSWCVNEQVLRGETVNWEWLSPKDNCWYYVINAPVQHPEGSLSCMAMIQDITERKQGEESLRRATRALRTLSEINRILVRTSEKSHLLNEVCRTIVEIGGYRLAWVGLAQEDEEKTVRPAGCAGFEEGYLDSVKISWADNEIGQGPTGVAVRTGKPAVCKNMLLDPSYKVWREEAAKRGYASSIALPLSSEVQTFGALNIYAPEPDAFDPEEVSLLELLADDLAYGILTLQARFKAGENPPEVT